MRTALTLAALLSLSSAAVGQCLSDASNFNNAVTGPVVALADWTPIAGGITRLVAGGLFTASPSNPDAFPCDFVGYWDGAQWHAMGWGTDGEVRTLAAWQSAPGHADMIAAGDFSTVGASSTGPLAALHIARFDGTRWWPLGEGLDGPVYALTTWDPDGPGPLSPWLIAGGNFHHAGNTPVDYIAAWDGVSWRGLGWGFDQSVNSLTTWDADGTGPNAPLLVAGGAFSSTGANDTGVVPALRVATWDGHAWAAMNVQNPSAGPVIQLVTEPATDASLPDSLIALQNWSVLAKWQATAWAPLNAGGIPRAIGLFDGGTGPQLWRAAEVIDWYVVYDGPTCIEMGGCWYMITTDYLISPDGFSSELPVDLIHAWDVDGPSGPTSPKLIVAGPFDGYVKAFRAVDPPLVTPPLAPQTAIPGQTVTIAMDVRGQVTSFNWSRNGITVEDGPQPSGSIISGAHTSTLTIHRIGTGDVRWNGVEWTADFYLFVANRCGSANGSAIVRVVPCSPDFNTDGDSGTDADIEAFFACLSGNCCSTCGSVDFNADGDSGTDADIEAFFRVLGGGPC